MAASSSSKVLLGFLFLFFSLLYADEFVFDQGFINEGGEKNTNNLTYEAGTTLLNGMLKLTNRTKNLVGNAFYSKPFLMFNNSSSSQNNVSSFSTTFVFSIVPSSSESGGFGLTFTIAPKTHFPEGQPGHYLGLFNSSNNNQPSNHIFLVEFDTVGGSGSGEADSEVNEIGINFNGLESANSTEAGYYEEGPNGNKKVNFSIEQADSVQAWIDYDGHNKIINVTVLPLSSSSTSSTKPTIPLMSLPYDLKHVLNETSYVGFSASTGENKASSHYILGWSFSMDGPAPQLDISNLPSPPSKEKDPSSFPWVTFVIGLLSALTLILLISLCSLTLYKRYHNFEALEDWELDCPHRFRYKDLHIATKGFKQSELIGVGGFGAVYKGILPSSGSEVAVKKIFRSPIQGMKEFAAEIESLGRLRHKNLVNLQGWCKQKNDLLLIYDYIPNGSLDSLLFHPQVGFVLNWEQRFNIIKGIANGLLYLHEEWEKVVIHRDIKTSNILIDADLNARLGDFGLARLYGHGEVSSHTTNVVGTIGYIAPELTRTGKPSTSSDVYAYGVLLLEVVCGRRPIGSGQFFLVDWVVENHNLGQILEVADPKLNSIYEEEEVEMVLKLGLLCAQHNADSRPTMRQVTRYLNFDDNLPEIGEWRRSQSDIDSESSRMSFGFLEMVSMSSTSYSTSHNLSSSISKNGKSIEAGR